MDMKTIILVLAVGHLFTVILISAYWRSNKKNGTLHAFFLAKCTQALAWLFLVMRGGVPDVFSISLANTMLFLGVYLETVAVLKLLQAFHPATQKLYAALTVFNIVGFHLIILFYNDEAIRIAFASFGTALLVILPAIKMLGGSRSSLLMRIMGILYCLVIVSLLGRSVAAIASVESMGLFTPGFYQTLSFLSLYLVMLLGNTGFVLLLKEQADRELIRLASFDELTGVWNRRTFIEKALLSIAACARKKLPITLLLFDVDYFKTINDTYGHIAGDRVLQNLTEEIRQQLRPEDLFGRYGGDEFALLLPGMGEAESTRFAEQLRKAAGEAEIPDRLVPYTLSMGLLTVVPGQDIQLEEMYISCDKALYQAKKNGRNGVARTTSESSAIILS